MLKLAVVAILVIAIVLVLATMLGALGEVRRSKARYLEWVDKNGDEDGV